MRDLRCRGHRGSRNIRSILKVVKAHDDEIHGYDPSVVHAITTAVDEINKGAPVPRRIGRLAVDLASSANSLGSWQRQAEILEQHIAVLEDQKTALEAATEQLRHSRDHALAERDALRHQLTEAQKEIDVLRGVRDALQAELIKARPSRRKTGLLEIAKASASAVVGALVAVGVPGLSA
jgi:chromosome segregation ATPase